MRNFSQTPENGGDEGADEERERAPKLPDLPPVPELPEVPELRPNLPPHPRQPASQDAKQYRQMGLAYTIPAALVAPIVVLTLGGWWLDERFHKSPAFTLAGAVLGMISGVVNMIRIANKLND